MSKPGPWLVAPFPGVFFRRSMAYWVLAHLVRIVLQAAIAARAPLPVELLPGGNPFVVLVVLGLGMLEARRRDEDLFLANLGYGWPTLAAYVTAPAAALEAAFTVGRFGWAMAGAYAMLPVDGLKAVLTGSP